MEDTIKTKEKERKLIQKVDKNHWYVSYVKYTQEDMDKKYTAIVNMNHSDIELIQKIRWILERKVACLWIHWWIIDVGFRDYDIDLLIFFTAL